jgi:hypothetical protein
LLSNSVRRRRHESHYRCGQYQNERSQDARIVQNTTAIDPTGDSHILGEGVEIDERGEAPECEPAKETSSLFSDWPGDSTQ